MDPSESCDDGNTANLDGCSEACAPEPGFDCPPTGGACTARCADNVAVGAEECDDGNLINGDGCDATCRLEHTCGNSQREPTEDCDDGIAGSASCSGSCAALGCTALDLTDPLVATVDGPVTWLEALVGGTALTPDASAPPCGTPALPWRFWHRVVVGPRPAALDVEVEDTALEGRTSAVWLGDGCSASALACAAAQGPARPARLATSVLPAGSVVFLGVGLDGASQPATYGLRITQRMQTRISGVTTCGAAPRMEPGIWWADSSTLGIPSLPGCPASGEAAVMQLHLAGVSDVTARIISPADAVLQAWSGDCAPAAALACPPGPLQLPGVPASDVWLRVVRAPGSDPIIVDVRAATVVPEGNPCDGTLVQCAAGLQCVGAPGTRVCTAPVGALYQTDFSSWDAALTVVDGLADGKTWTWCDGAAGCTAPNLTTGGGPFAWLADDATALNSDETLTLAELDAALASGVFLSLRQALTGAGTGYLEVQTGGAGFVPVATVQPGESGALNLDLTPWAAGAPAMTLRLRYARGAVPGAAGTGWQVDDVLVLPY